VTINNTNPTTGAVEIHGGAIGGVFAALRLPKPDRRWVSWGLADWAGRTARDHPRITPR
jgi:hypothetical protein